MRSPIPKEILETLNADPWMQKCIISDARCDGRIEWNHAMTYSGKRVNELYTILPLCHAHHVRQASFRKEQEQAIRDRVRYFDMEEDFKRKYPRATLYPRVIPTYPFAE